MTDITIPPEALEAAKSAYTAAIYRGNGTAREYHEAMSAACLAMLRAWPFRKDEWRDNITFDGKPVRYSVITLPLPQETRDE